MDDGGIKNGQGVGGLEGKGREGKWGILVLNEMINM